MKKNLTIATIIPHRNELENLSNCLISLLSQSKLPNQIIIIDDVSSVEDPFLEAREILKNFHNVIFIQNSIHKGTAASINIGLSYVKSDYVHLYSVNDRITDNFYLKSCESILELKQRPGIWSAMINMKIKNTILAYPSPVISLKERYFSPKECRSLLFRVGNWFTGTTMLLLHKELLKIGGLDDKYGGLADMFAAFHIASYSGAVFSPTILGEVRYHNEGYLSSTLTNEKQMKEIYHNIINIESDKFPEIYSSMFIKRIINRLKFSVVIRKNNSSKKIHKKVVGYSKILINFLILRPYDVFYFFKYRIFNFYLLKVCDKSFLTRR